MSSETFLARSISLVFDSVNELHALLSLSCVNYISIDQCSRFIMKKWKNEAAFLSWRIFYML